MRAKLSGALPADDAHWVYEMKWDGIRALSLVEGGKLRIMTRNQIDVTKRYPELDGIGSQFAKRNAIRDGKIVGFDEHGRPKFEALHERMGLEGGRRVASRPGVAVAYMVFDLLCVDDTLLLQSPYEARRERLEDLHLEADHWVTPTFAVGDGAAMLQASREQGMEGVVAKRLGSRYEPGKRSGSWLKVKNQHRQEFVIGGWIPGQGTSRGATRLAGRRLLPRWHARVSGKRGHGLHRSDTRRTGEATRTTGAEHQPVFLWRSAT